MSQEKHRLGYPVAMAGHVMAVLCGFAMLMAAWLHRAQVLDTKRAIGVFFTAVLVSFGAFFICFMGAILTSAPGRRRGFVPALLGLLLSAGLMGNAYYWKHVARKAPAIYDITTDTMNPPDFIAVIPLRKGAPNPAHYPGFDAAVVQLKAYPQIKTAALPLPPEAALEKAAAVAARMKWAIVAKDKVSGRLEATDTTPWFGFKEDIVVRVQPAAGGGSRVDVRSASREGRSDLGSNAKRIQEFLTRLNKV